MIKKPVVLTASGVAACIGLVAVLVFTGNGAVDVQAAEIIQKLSDQIEQKPVFEITVDALRFGQVELTGELTLAERGAVGDVEVTVDFSHGELASDWTVEADAAFAADGADGWVLLRSLTMPTEQMQAIVDQFLPAGEPVLVSLSGGGHHSELNSDLAEVYEELNELRSEKAVSIIGELVESHGDYDATVERQPDGNVLMTMQLDLDTLIAIEELERRLYPTESRATIEVTVNGESRIVSIEDDESDDGASDLDIRTTNFEDPEVKAILESAGIAVTYGDDGQVIMQTPDGVTIIQTEGGLALSRSGAPPAAMRHGHPQTDFIGSTLRVVYDPVAERVCSFSIEDFGPAKGTVTVTMQEGEFDPALLDSASVTTPATMTIDMAVFEAMGEELERVFE
jgi:hypothetical protein